MTNTNITFGAYNGKPINWRVLDVQDEKALLLLEDILEQRPYNDAFKAVTWEDCSLRQYLNGEFFKSVFSVEGQRKICCSTLSNHANPIWAMPGGDCTADAVFLLSVSEALAWLPEPNDRKASAWWWLRSPGLGQFSAAYVGNDGDVYLSGNYVDNETGGVRPALWLNLES